MPRPGKLLASLPLPAPPPRPPNLSSRLLLTLSTSPHASNSPLLSSPHHSIPLLSSHLIRLCDSVLERPSLLTVSQRVKAHYRRHQARFARQQHEEALADLLAAKELDPKNDQVDTALMGVRWAKKLADKAQRAQFGGMFNKGGDEGRGPAVSTELYKEEKGIPPWVGDLPTCWMDFAIGGKVVGRVVIELNVREAPRSCENFRSLCTGERGNGALSKAPLHYRSVRFHRVIRNFLIQGGDIVSGDGMGGESIYGGQFGDENLEGKHDAPGVVSMANAGRDMNGSQFFITTCAAPHLDKTAVVVGRVVVGMEVVRMVERVEVDGEDRPRHSVIVEDCGSATGEIPHTPLPVSEWPEHLKPKEEPSEAERRVEFAMKREAERKRREAEEEEAEAVEEAAAAVEEVAAEERIEEVVVPVAPPQPAAAEEDDDDDEDVVIEEV